MRGGASGPSARPVGGDRVDPRADPRCASVRAWLYRIATNVCLDFLERRPDRADIPLPDESGAPAEISWLQPYPDRLLAVAAPEDEPGAVMVTRETIELAFLVAVQHLPPRQRAVLILRDVLDWSAKQTATLPDLDRPRDQQRTPTGARHHAQAPSGPAARLADSVRLRR